MNTILLLIDSLNRHQLAAYGGEELHTPNIDRLAARGLVFDHHWACSMPCIPARRDLMTGRASFLESSWCPMQPWDVDLPGLLRREAGVSSHLITDHHHYFHSGGEGYHTLYDSWEFNRGQEWDPWRPAPGGVPHKPEFRGQNDRWPSYWPNRERLEADNDLAYPSVRNLRSAADFLDRFHERDNWFLQIENFDPHEPFQCPAHYLREEGDRWTGPLYDWPQYGPCEDEPEAVAHVRARYAASVRMTDRYIGELLDRLDRHNLWATTRIFLVSDHGHLLGDDGWWGKNLMRDRGKLVHTPLIVAGAGVEANGRRSGLTSMVDLMPTLLEGHGVKPPDCVRGRSFAPLFQEDKSHRDTAIAGYFGKDLNVVARIEGHDYLYCRQPAPDSITHDHTLMPRSYRNFIRQDVLAEAEWDHFLPHARPAKVLRLPKKSQRSRDNPEHGHPLFDTTGDPDETTPLDHPEIEEKILQRLRSELQHCEAPPCQAERLKL